MRNRNHIHMTSEGFSFHTIELKQTYFSTAKYNKIFEQLMRSSKDKDFYNLADYGEGRYFCGHFSKHGIRIYLSSFENRHTIKLVINPRKLIEPDSSYLGIMMTDEKSLDKMEHHFTDLMRKIGLPDFMDDWALTRIDLCVNFVFDRKKLPKQIIQLISRGPVPADYERSAYSSPAYKDPDGNISLEKHSVKFFNKRIALVAYDKAYQMKAEGLPSPADLKKRGILRLELQCGRNWIADESSKYGCKTVREKLNYFAAHSREYLCKYANTLYLSGEYYRRDLLIRKIQASDSITKKSKARMIQFVNMLDSNCDFDIAFQTLSEALSKKQLRTLVDNFASLNIVPIPLMEKCELKSILSIPSILNEMDDCAFEKRFSKKKRYIVPLSISACTG